MLPKIKKYSDTKNKNTSLFNVNTILAMSDSPETFAQWLRKARHDADLTLDQVAERTGIKKQHISALERAAPASLTGKASVPRRPTVEKLAKGLRRPLNEALAAAGYASSEAPAEYAALFHRLDAVSDEQKRTTALETVAQNILNVEVAKCDLKEIYEAVKSGAMSFEDFERRLAL